MATSSVSNQKTIQQIIDSSSKSTSDRKTGELGKDDFLNLLVTQLKYQDPLKPVDDKEFIGQMAQFSSLEQMQNMSNSLTQSQAYSLVGKHVKASYIDDTTKTSVAIEGDVTAVKTNSGKTYVVVKGKDIPVEKVTDVSEGIMSSDSNLSQFTNLIGYNALGGVYDSETGDIVGVTGTVKSVQKGLYEDYAVMDNVSVNISAIDTDTPSTDSNFMKNYLDSHLPSSSNTDTTVAVKIKDPSTGKEVPVTAALKSYQYSNGKYTAVLDNVQVPVTSIANVTPGPKSNQEVLLQQILDKLNSQINTTGGNNSSGG